MDTAEVEIGVGAAAGAVDQLIGHHDRAGLEFRVQAADRTRPEDPPHTKRAQRHMLARYGTACAEYW